MRTKFISILALTLIAFNSFAGKTPSLKEAVMGQDFDKTKTLLEAGADANEQWSSAPALYWAALQGRVDVIKLLVEKGALVDATGLMGITPLAGVIAHPKTPAEYVEENNKLNEKILKHFTVEKAKEKGWYKETDVTKFSTVAERIQVLLELGANPNFLLGNMTVKDGTPFLNAVKTENVEYVKAMFVTKKVDTELRYDQWAEKVVSFVKTIDVGKYEKMDRKNAQDWAGVPQYNTPLLFAVEKQNLELVKALVENGADINNGKKIEYNEGSTHHWEYWGPLDVAIKAKKPSQEIIDYLTSKGAIQYQK